MGWRFAWVSAFGSDFNYDYHVSFTKDQLSSGKAIYNFEEAPVPANPADTELPGLSAFYKNEVDHGFCPPSRRIRGITETARLSHRAILVSRPNSPRELDYCVGSDSSLP
jgi:predicted dithiol-disulfide oxidoreductase (DUF899 family)